TFRAYVFESFGDALEEIKLRTSVPQTIVGPTQVRIKVHAAALNPIDWKVVEFGKAFLPTAPSAENPFRLGFDVAGTLVEVGADVSANDFKVGDAVLGMAYFGETGSFAEYFVSDAKYVALKPASLSFNHAAGLSLAGKTSYQALITHGKLKEGDRVLILGGSSATGALGIQIAKALGAAHVIATTSTRNVELVKSFGADEVVDYTKEKWGDVLEPHSIDLIY
ncbi:Quinone oxidoreductase protein, partial [Globisporangium polare]